jgi:hypothetical protein
MKCTLAARRDDPREANLRSKAELACVLVEHEVGDSPGRKCHSDRSMGGHHLVAAVAVANSDGHAVGVLQDKRGVPLQGTGNGARVRQDEHPGVLLCGLRHPRNRVVDREMVCQAGYVPLGGRRRLRRCRSDVRRRTTNWMGCGTGAREQHAHNGADSDTPHLPNPPHAPPDEWRRPEVPPPRSGVEMPGSAGIGSGLIVSSPRSDRCGRVAQAVRAHP